MEKQWKRYVFVVECFYESQQWCLAWCLLEKVGVFETQSQLCGKHSKCSKSLWKHSTTDRKWLERRSSVLSALVRLLVWQYFLQKKNVISFNFDYKKKMLRSMDNNWMKWIRCPQSRMSWKTMKWIDRVKKN